MNWLLFFQILALVTVPVTIIIVGIDWILNNDVERMSK